MYVITYYMTSKFIVGNKFIVIILFYYTAELYMLSEMMIYPTLYLSFSLFLPVSSELTTVIWSVLQSCQQITNFTSSTTNWRLSGVSIRGFLKRCVTWLNHQIMLLSEMHYANTFYMFIQVVQYARIEQYHDWINKHV